MKKIGSAIVICFFCFGIYGQSPSNNIFKNGDKINITKESQSVFSYYHTIEKGQSLYALASIFDISVEKLRRYNGINADTPLRIGQIIKIPMYEDQFFKGNSLNGVNYGHYIPIYYQAQPKDNLFRISRVYFDQPIEDLKSRNNLNSNAISVGQEILVGWFRIDNSPTVNPTEEFVEDFDDFTTEAPVLGNKDFIYELSSDDEELKVQMDSSSNSVIIPADFNVNLLGTIPYSEEIVSIKKSEVANWDNTIQDNGTVYVLHKEAIIDSYVELYNPLLKRTIKAKVIGRIPYGAYTKKVSLVLSPQAAKQLGGLDKRFKVEVSALVYKDI